jgi:hypothetical protein
MKHHTMRAVLTALLLAGSAARCVADIVTVPPGLSPGDQYRLVFVTSDRTNGYSANLDTYNALATQDAASVPVLGVLGAQWSAIATTVNEAIYDTIDRAPGVPIYNLAGQLVANDATRNVGSLFGPGPSGNDFFNPIDITENGVVYSSLVWTGSYYNGGNSPSYALGSTFAGSDFIAVGWASQTNETWLLWSYFGASAEFPVYAISSVLTVPSAVPEPSAAPILATGCALLLATHLRRAVRTKKRTFAIGLRQREGDDAI